MSIRPIGRQSVRKRLTVKSSALCFCDSLGNIGGAYRDRTDDPLLAKQVLSQLS